jgi:cytochrome P450
VPGFPLGASVGVDELTGDPHPALARLRSQEPVSWLPALSAWLVTRHDLARVVLADPGTFTVDDPRFSTAQVVGPSMLSLEGAEHARHRAPFGKDFRRLDHLAVFAQEEARRLLDGLRAAGAAELRRGFAGPLAVSVMAESLGLHGVEPSTVLSWYDAIVSAVDGVSAGIAPGERSRSAFAALRAGIEASIARGRPSLLVAAAGELELSEVVSNAAVLMFGGIETTEGMIATALRDVLARPALEDPLDLVVEESMRLEPAAAMVDRYATRDTSLADARIQAGDKVIVSITGANRDPAVFAEPDTFDPARQNLGRHLTFAHGPHFCVGLDLARLQARVALRTLLDGLPGLRLDGPAPVRGLVFRKPDTVPVRWP